MDTMIGKRLVETAFPIRRPDKIDMAILAQHAQFHRDESDQNFRRLVIIVGTVVAFVGVGLIFAAMREQSTLTPQQQQVLADHPQDN